MFLIGMWRQIIFYNSLRELGLFLYVFTSMIEVGSTENRCQAFAKVKRDVRNTGVRITPHLSFKSYEVRLALVRENWQRSGKKSMTFKNKPGCVARACYQPLE